MRYLTEANKRDLIFFWTLAACLIIGGILLYLIPEAGPGH